MPPDPLATRPPPVLAINLGRAEADRLELRVAAPSVGEAFSPSFATPGAAALAARNVLLTDTALKTAGFRAAEDARACPLSPFLLLSASKREVSVSDPPLMLGSAEFTKSSTISAMCLFASSSGETGEAAPFREGVLESTSLGWSLIFAVWKTR